MEGTKVHEAFVIYYLLFTIDSRGVGIFDIVFLRGSSCLRGERFQESAWAAKLLHPTCLDVFTQYEIRYTRYEPILAARWLR